MIATERWAVVWADDESTGAPPGIDQVAFARACVEDVVEMVSDLTGVRAALACSASYDRPELLVWPGTPVLRAAGPADALGQAHAAGAAVAVLVAGDAPDLPPLLLGKVFSALSAAHPSTQVAVTPCQGGGLVAFAARLPYAGAVDLDAPSPEGAARGPGWHRLRVPSDVHRLDPGLEGWDATRALLSGWHQPLT